MGRPRIPADVVQQIAAIWIGNPTLTATKVYQRASGMGRRPSLRKVQEIVREARRRSETSGIPLEDPKLVPWGPEWPTDDADDIACLFRLLATADVTGHRLNTRTARWALKLRKVFEGGWEGSILHLSFAYLYGGIEKGLELMPQGLGIADYTLEEMCVNLNESLMLRFWESEEEAGIYKEAMLRGIAAWPGSSLTYECVPGICKDFVELLDLDYSSKRPTTFPLSSTLYTQAA